MFRTLFDSIEQNQHIEQTLKETQLSLNQLLFNNQLHTFTDDEKERSVFVMAGEMEFSFFF